MLASKPGESVEQQCEPVEGLGDAPPEALRSGVPADISLGRAQFILEPRIDDSFSQLGSKKWQL